MSEEKKEVVASEFGVEPTAAIIKSAKLVMPACGRAVPCSACVMAGGCGRGGCGGHRHEESADTTEQKDNGKE